MSVPQYFHWTSAHLLSGRCSYHKIYFTITIFVVLWQPFGKWWSVEIFQCRDIIIYPHIKFWWYRTMLNFCGIVADILKMAIDKTFFNVGNQFGTSLSTHLSNFDDIGQCWIFTTHFLCRVLVAILKILKTQNCSSNGDLSLCQILCLSLSI